MQIVIAWVETVHVHDGQPWSADLGTRPGMREERRAVAAMWTSAGTDKDVTKASEWARKSNTSDDPTRHVFVYPADEPDPLGRAKADALAADGVGGAR